MYRFVGRAKARPDEDRNRAPKKILEATRIRAAYRVVNTTQPISPTVRARAEKTLRKLQATGTGKTPKTDDGEDQSDQESSQESDQESNQGSDRESDRESDQEPNQESDQESDQETDSETGDLDWDILPHYGKKKPSGLSDEVWAWLKSAEITEEERAILMPYIDGTQGYRAVLEGFRGDPSLPANMHGRTPDVPIDPAQNWVRPLQEKASAVAGLMLRKPRAMAKLEYPTVLRKKIICWYHYWHTIGGERGPDGCNLCCKERCPACCPA